MSTKDTSRFMQSIGEISPSASSKFKGAICWMKRRRGSIDSCLIPMRAKKKIGASILKLLAGDSKKGPRMEMNRIRYGALDHLVDLIQLVTGQQDT
jgi:hypothetical protein